MARKMFREAIEYPGFSFVHVLAGCVTYQPRGYADQLLQRSYALPAGLIADTVGVIASVIVCRLVFG